MKGKGCRDKGNRFERFVAKMLDAWSGTKEFSRAWLSRGQDERTDDLRCPTWFPFIVSCKHVEKWSLDELFRTNGGLIRQWWVEIERKATRGTSPMLIFRKNHFPAMIVCGTKDRLHWTERSIYFDTGNAVSRLDEWLEENPATQWKGEKR